MAHEDGWELLFKRADFSVSEIRRPPSAPLSAGEVRLATEKFALTMNNVTYARLGESELPFWEAFPAPTGYGRLPVWGYARVAESRHPDIAVGARYFGYLPLGTEHTVPAAEVLDRGFLDTGAQRGFMLAWYRTYQAVPEPADSDDRRAVIRPLFPASFNLADFLAGHAARGVRSVLVSGASSKTAIGLAHLLAGNTELKTVALTSRLHVPFLEGLGLYGTVVAYEEVADVPTGIGPAVFVDFTGTEERMSRIYEYFGDELVHTALVGYTHPGAVIEPPELGPPAPEIFFTPDVEERTVLAEGAAGYYARYAAAENGFLEASRSWLSIEQVRGPEAAAEIFGQLVAGAAPPDVATVVTV